jgi:Short C-terminal domain
MGLLRGVARTAVVAGTATAVSNRVSRRQSNRWAQQEAYDQQLAYEQQQAYAQQGYAATPGPVTPDTDDQLAQLRELGELKASGVLTDAEFEAQKAKILAR